MQNCKNPNWLYTKESSVKEAPTTTQKATFAFELADTLLKLCVNGQAVAQIDLSPIIPSKPTPSSKKKKAE